MKHLKKITRVSLLLTVFVALAACATRRGAPPFVAVSRITGVPAEGTAGVNLSLGGTVEPSGATNQTVAWSVQNAGTTGASISGTTLTTAGVGTVTVTATIADGLAAGTDYTQDFNISVLATPARYREMILATPDAAASVTIAGDSAYYYDPATTDEWRKGAFIAGRTVTLSPFTIAKYETTYELWYEVKQWATDADRGANVYTFANQGSEGHDGTAGDPPADSARLEPVTTINWRDAIVWCNAYSEMSGKTPAYYADSSCTAVLRVSTNDSGTATAADGAVIKPGADGYRLPTEAQWEYAARGGGTPSAASSFAYKWAGTNTESELGNYAWYNANSGGATHPAGEKTANALGLHDMSGNVWEWCWDWYGSPVDTGTAADPAGPALSPDLARVVRGGGWDFDASIWAVAYRGLDSPGDRYDNRGFRVVCSLVE